jgi:hypothetical protein
VSGAAGDGGLGGAASDAVGSDGLGGAGRSGAGGCSWRSGARRRLSAQGRVAGEAARAAAAGEWRQ